MTEPHHAGCPDASVLAAFVEGKLSPEDHAAMVHHVADCPDCVTLIGETSQFLKDLEDQGSTRTERPWWWISVAAGIALFVVPLLVWRERVPDNPLSGMHRIAAALAHRPVEGRLTGFAHRPFVAPRSGRDLPRIDLSLSAEAERIERRHAGRSAADLHARGIAALLTGRHQGALALLSGATRVASGNAAYWNDLSVAQLAAATATGDDRLARAALESADRALSLTPSADSHFNRAVALEALGQPVAAERAYQQALGADPRSPWAEEIEAQLERLRN